MIGLDAFILTFLNQFAQRSWTFDSCMVFITSSNLLKGGVFTMALWWAWFTGDEAEQERRRRVVLNTLFAGFIAVFTARALALCLPFRLRPSHNPDLDFVLPFTMKVTRLEAWSAFPSDHGALFYCLATGMLFISRAWGVAALAYVLAVICIPRMYVGLHYPTDIFAGALIGVSAGTFTNRSSEISRVLDARLLAWSRRHPAAFYAGFFLLTHQVATLFHELRDLGSFGLETVWNVVRLFARRGG